MGIKLFEFVNKKAELTGAGKLILKRSQHIVSQLSQLENAITHFKKGDHHKFTILVDELFPIDLQINLFDKLANIYPQNISEQIYSNNQFDEAILIYQQALEIKPSDQAVMNKIDNVAATQQELAAILEAENQLNLQFYYEF